LLLPYVAVKRALSTPRTNLKDAFLGGGRREGDGSGIVWIVVAPSWPGRDARCGFD